MKRIFITILMLVLLPTAAFAQDGKPTKKTAKLTPADVANRIQEFYKKTADFQATFVQTYHDIAADSKKVSKGKVYFKKPGKMRWDYKKAKDTKKMDKLYVSDGKEFWVYEYEFQQVFKQCLKDSQLPTSLSFLMGTGNLLTDFNVTFAKKSTTKSPILKLVPKKPTSKYKELRFNVDPTTFQVTRTTLFDPYGNTNEIVFSGTLLNKNLPDSGFAFRPPKGSRVLNPQKACK